MKKATLLILFLLLSACSGLHGQTFSLITGRQPVASLDGLWRFHTGDNPAWANPNFDDSQWALLRSDKDWAPQGYKGYSGFAWYRFRVLIPSGSDHLSLLLPPIATSYQVYVDGTLIGSFSRMPPHELVRMPMPAVYPMDIGKAAGPKEATVALRVWHWSGWAPFVGGGTRTGGGLVGATSLIDVQLQHLNDARLLSNGASYSLAILTGTAAMMALLLFVVRRKETEYLWFAIYEFSMAILFTLSIYEDTHAVPLFRRDMADTFVSFVAQLSLVFFLQKLLRGRRSVLFYLAIAAVAAYPISYLMLMLGIFGSVGGIGVGNAAFALVVFAWACNLLVRRAKDDLPDARLLLAPVLISMGLGSARDVLWGAFQLGWTKTYYGRYNLFNSPFPFPVDYLVEVLFLIAMLAILGNRFMRSRHEEQRLTGELEAARSMQSLLIPATAPNTPGFTVESVYIPASEVGGDFFQILPGDDGSLLIVVGDVSGKGLKAAMTVSTIVGALRAYPLRAPVEVLANLNRVLHGQVGGFVTCMAALIAADGAMSFANAGNLAPYCNGKEMPADSGLPLGMLAESNYSETHYQLALGDRLTFVSDGVLEATNDKHELFGFERTQAISNQPAQLIADTAKGFGQEDDISVLSVTRTLNAQAATA